jgi:hypothetical protein
MAYKNFRKKKGPSFDFYKLLAVNWTQFGDSDGYTLTDGYGPDIAITFPTHGLSFITYGATSANTIEYSFNGTDVHGDMVPGTSSASLVFDFRPVSTIWFRLKAGSTGPVNIRIEAWGRE